MLGVDETSDDHSGHSFLRTIPHADTVLHAALCAGVPKPEKDTNTTSPVGTSDGLSSFRPEGTLNGLASFPKQVSANT